MKKIISIYVRFFKLTLLCLGLIFSVQLSFLAQGNFESQNLWSRESFGTYEQSMEILSKRNANSKHFFTNDGKTVALLASGNFHYFEENRWKTIFHSIVRTSDGFENTTNKFKSFYPLNAGDLLTTKLENGSILTEMLNMRMYYEVNNQAIQIQPIQNSPGVENFNELIYTNVYGNGIDLKLTQHTEKRKMDYVLQNSNILSSIPAGADYLVFEETIRLPLGWLAKLEGNEILLVDENGFVKARYDKPKFTDTPHIHETENGENHEHISHETEGVYEVIQIGFQVVIKTKVDITWLLNSDINFPVYIDPSLNCYPENLNNWTGFIRTEVPSTPASNNCYDEGCVNYVSTTITGTEQDQIYMGKGGASPYNTWRYVHNSWAQFDVSSLPSDVCVESVDLHYRVNYNNSYLAFCSVGGYIKHMATDPSVAASEDILTDIRDGDIYTTTNFMVLASNSNAINQTKPLSTNLHHLENAAASPSGKFAIGLHAASGTSQTTCYNTIDGHSLATKPYLTVVYGNDYVADWIHVDAGCNEWLPGETRTVNITVENTGCKPWTSGGSAGNVNFAWWGSWQSGQASNPQLTPYSNFTHNSTQVISFTVTAPMTLGAHTIHVDNERNGSCWFRNNDGTCGPGNIDFSFPINVSNGANTSSAQVCVGNTIDFGLTLPTGGTITEIGNDRIHTFTTVGTSNFVVPTGFSNTVEYLIVAGGGGGGGITTAANRGAGGGGAGGLRQGSVAVTPQTYSIEVGAGGSAGTGAARGGAGGNSLFNGIESIGGGGGGSTSPTAGGSGGSGGGNRATSTTNTGTSGQGNNGGNFNTNSGGGGGAGAVGDAGSANMATFGMGGNGLASSISGTSTYYAGGGAAGRYNVANGGTGGLGGGGGSPALRGNGFSGTNGLGGGGGGATGSSASSTAHTGGTGGSGVVIIRYTKPILSDNPAVATVDNNGVVTGVAPGVANITISNGGTCQTVQVTVSAGSTESTLVDGGGTICEGNVVNLTSVGGINGSGAIHVWYDGGCNNVYTQLWNNQPFTITNTSANTSYGILNVTALANDPSIIMDALGSFDPATYKYINIRYRGNVSSGELFFHNTAHPTAHPNNLVSTALVNDGEWHIAAIDLSANPNYIPANGNITGWRYNWANLAGASMEIDFIQLSEFPMIDDEGDDNTVTIEPNSPHYPNPGETKTYATAKIDDCGTTGCTQTTVTLGNQGTVLAVHGEQQTCIVNANETVHFYHPVSGRYIASVEAGASNLGSVTATVYDDGSPVLVYECGNPSTADAIHYLERHWVITPTTNGPANVYLPYWDSERAALMTVANSNDNPTDDVTGQENLILSKYSGGAFPSAVNVDNDFDNNCPPPVSTGVGGIEEITNNGYSMVEEYIANFSTTAEYSSYPISGFSEFWLHGQIENPLPVSMKNFAATCSDEIYISWTTASEQNTAYFTLERSRDGNQWENVKTINSKGTTSYSTDYHVVENVSLTKAYYRLKQVDLDGNTEYFGPIAMDCNTRKNFMDVFPNPTSAGFTVEIFTQDKLSNTTLAIYDISGKLVDLKEVNCVFGVNSFTFSKGIMEPGTYIIVLEGKDKNRFIPKKLVVE
jgi:hypothetical protein